MADRRQSPSFFVREGDGSARVRIRFKADEAALIEEAAGTTPLMTWIHQTLGEAARREVLEARLRRPRVGPPEEE